MVVSAEKIERRIEQPRFLYSQIDGISSLIGAKTARAQALVGFARVFIFIRIANFQSALPSSLENAQHVPWLRDLPARQRIEKSQQSLTAPLFSGRRGRLNQCLRSAGLVVAFAKPRVLHREVAVVVERGAPEHAAMGHHAAGHVFRLRLMAAAVATRLLRHADVTRVNEADKLPTLARQQRISAFRICAGEFAVSFPFFREARLYVSRALDALDLTLVVADLSRHGIAAVAGSTREAEGVFAL